MDAEMREFLDVIKSPDKELESLLLLGTYHVPRDSEASVKFRQEGNKLFQKSSHTSKHHEEIFRLYNKSISKAPERSEELATGFANRSAFLLHIKRYKDCIIDIDRAVQITCSQVLKVKLLCRKVKCLSLLGQPNTQNVLDEVEILMEGIPVCDENKKKLIILFDETKSFLDTVKEQKNVLCNDEKFENANDLDVKEDIFKSVEIKFNKKFGRYLIATRDIQPGEIIFVEKLDISCLCPEKMHTNCYYCFKTCWTGIPCDNCSWAMFCSEECKKEAIKKYHDMECSIIPCLQLFGSEFFSGVYISLRLLIIGMKETGGIKKLKSHLQSNVKNYQDILKHEKTSSFTAACNLNSYVSIERSKVSSNAALAVILCLAKSTPFFGKPMEFEKIKDLAEYEEVIFIGSLFLKLLKIRQINSYDLSNLGKRFSGNGTRQSNSGLAVCIPIVASLLNHSCMPNVGKCFTEDKRMIVFARLPIKKNTQMFDSYFGSMYNYSKEQRKMLLEDYPFTCDCPVCQFGLSNELSKDITISKMEYELGLKIKEMDWLQNPDIYRPCSWKIIQELSEAVIKATRSLPERSIITLTLSGLLTEAFHRVYDFERNIFSSCVKK